ncbi:CreA protein [Paraburkholderia atlantica]
MKGPHPCGPFCFYAPIGSLTRAARRYTMAASRRTFHPSGAGSLQTPTGTLMKSTSLHIALAAIGALLLSSARGEEIASVNTNFHVTGSDRVVVEAYDDPVVQGVTCYVSRARTGGVKGTLGIAEDPTEASIACRQVGELHFTGPIKQKDDVFSVSMSLIFKSLHVVRVVDTKRNALVYLTYSDRVVSGSAKNSVSAVPMPTGTTIPLK